MSRAATTDNGVWRPILRSIRMGVIAPADPDITHIRIKVDWLRYSDYRAESFVIEEAMLD